MALSFQPTHDALKNLKEALDIKNPSDLERDGTVQRFEYCYEILWKLAQKILKQYSIEAEYPKSVFRELGKIGWISNVEAWIEFQSARNNTSHEYGKNYAVKSFELAKVFMPLANELFLILQEKNRD